MVVDNLEAVENSLTEVVVDSLAEVAVDNLAEVVEDNMVLDSWKMVDSLVVVDNLIVDMVYLDGLHGSIQIELHLKFDNKIRGMFMTKKR